MAAPRKGAPWTALAPPIPGGPKDAGQGTMRALLFALLCMVLHSRNHILPATKPQFGCMLQTELDTPSSESSLMGDGPTPCFTASPLSFRLSPTLYASLPSLTQESPSLCPQCLPSYSHDLLTPPPCLCSSSALSTSSCGPGTVGLCSRRPPWHGQGQDQGQGASPRAQLSREQWRSSKQPPATPRQDSTSSITSGFQDLPLPFSSNFPPPPFWALRRLH